MNVGLAPLKKRKDGMRAARPLALPEIRTEFITDFSGIESIAGDWDRLWRIDPRATIFSSLPWARAWWRAFGKGRWLCTAVVRQGDKVVGILPLAAERGTLRFLGDPRSDYSDMLCDPAAGPEVVVSALRGLAEAPVSWRRCVLRNLPEGANLLTALPRIELESGWLTHREVESSCSAVDLSTDREQVFAGIIGKKHSRRRENTLGRLGKLNFRHLEDRGEVRVHLPNLFRQHTARRAMVGEKSIFSDPECRLFFEALAEEMDPAREFRFSVLEVDDKPLCYHLGFESGGVFLAYKPTFDVDYWQYSAGEVLFKRLFEYVKDRPVQKFDFTVGDEEYKSRFANRITQNHTLYLFRRGPGGAAGKLLVQGLHAIRNRPALHGRLKAAVEGRKEVPHRLRALANPRMICRRAVQACASAWRRWVFTRDPVHVFALERADAASAGGQYEVKEARLSDLACLAEAHGKLLTATRLHSARDRLRQGDKAHTVWKAGQLVMVAFSGTRSEINAAAAEESPCRFELECPSQVIYDRWISARALDEEVCQGELRLAGNLSGADASSGPQPVYCLVEHTPAWVRQRRKAGWRLCCRMRRARLFHALKLGPWRMERMGQ